MDVESESAAIKKLVQASYRSIDLKILFDAMKSEWERQFIQNANILLVDLGYIRQTFEEYFIPHTAKEKECKKLALERSKEVMKTFKEVLLWLYRSRPGEERDKILGIIRMKMSGLRTGRKQLTFLLKDRNRKEKHLSNGTTKERIRLGGFLENCTTDTQ